MDDNVILFRNMTYKLSTFSVWFRSFSLVTCQKKNVSVTHKRLVYGWKWKTVFTSSGKFVSTLKFLSRLLMLCCDCQNCWRLSLQIFIFFSWGCIAWHLTVGNILLFYNFQGKSHIGRPKLRCFQRSAYNGTTAVVKFCFQISQFYTV